MKQQGRHIAREAFANLCCYIDDLQQAQAAIVVSDGNFSHVMLMLTPHLLNVLLCAGIEILPR